jgi:hypothetical protein
LEDLDQWLIPFRNLMQNIEMGKARQRAVILFSCHCDTLRVSTSSSQ